MSEEGLRFRPRVAVVDANVALGHGHDQPSPAADAPALLATLDRHGVQRAVVHNVYAQTKSAVEGNALLFEAIAGQEARLIPQCVVSPTDASLAQLRDFHGRGLLRSVRLHDLSKQGVPFADWVHGDALAWLQEQGIALCVPLPEVDVAQLATTLQRLPGIAGGAGGGALPTRAAGAAVDAAAAATAPGAESLRDVGRRGGAVCASSAPSGCCTARGTRAMRWGRSSTTCTTRR